MAAAPPPDRDLPLWLIFSAVAGVALYAFFLTDEDYSRVLAVMVGGIEITVMVTVVAFAGASALGLGLALGQLSRWLILRQLCRLYVEIMRGVPILVLLLYVAFVMAPGMVALWNSLGLPELRSRDVPFLLRAIIALCLAYAAFLSEIFRAGIQSVDPGQIEAAEALGLNRWQRFRHVVWPQALGTMLPPLGNDFVAMIKDSSLVSVVGVADIAQLGKTWAAGNYRYLETYNVMAVLYMTMTIGLSLALRRLERRLRDRTARDAD